ncbi:MAG: hypothetical protein EOL95_09140 [Bacteroidia bacterium]|nr:hypothetical protein [Bacteroidia bacterium]
MYSFFEYYFPESDWGKEEVAVCCPFPHHISTGQTYQETRPSAHINKEKRVFNCKVCGASYSEVGFVAATLDCTYEIAVKLLKQFSHDSEDLFTFKEHTTFPEEIKEKCNNLGITDEVIEELSIRSEFGDDIAFPVTMYDKILDVRNYRPGETPKIKSRKGALTGLIIPFDVWRLDEESNKWTVLCAGEKDMAVARSNGFNAITLTGGEQALPLFKNYFKNKRIAICYDNDDAGARGANKIAAHLFGIAKEIKVVTEFHKVCKEIGEDITDYFMKYEKTRDDLIQCIKQTPAYTITELQEEQQRTQPLITLIEATKPQYINRVVRSNIQVVATFDSTFVVPTTITAKKTALSGNPKSDKMLLGEEKTWYLGEDTAADILKLIDNNFNEEQIRLNVREILRISKGEKDVSVQKLTKETVHKASVTDYFEVNMKDVVPIEFTAYSIKRKLDSGKKYRATYKLVPHPYKGQSLIMIILDIEDASDSVSKFEITDQVKNHLDVVRTMKGSVDKKITTLTEKFKGVLGYDGYNQLIQCFDLAYHTVLEFNFGTFKNVRGYLDTLIVAESRVGKSTTAETMQKLYQLGTFTSLAGSSATIAGLVGGSNKVNGSYQTRAGSIPQNHRGLMILEELGKSNSSVLKELTDIKSSNQVRITRVSGTLTLPALVRMITITNVKSAGDRPRSINSYPNGLEILLDLIETPEDVARFDIMLVLGAKGDKDIDPYWEPQTPLDPEVYKTRIRWVWSRSADQVIIDKDLGIYIIEQCNLLNKEFNSYIKIFGTEAWKKVTRLAIAVAGYLVSTDETYSNIIVCKEHVDYALKFMRELYDNETFRLREYVEQERKYNTIDEDGVALLQELYIATPSLLITLHQTSASNRNNLMAATGLSSDDFNKVMNKLVRGLFVRYQGYEILPTERFRIGMNRINRNVVVTRVGEENV